MMVKHPDQSPAQTLAVAEAWYAAQMARLEQCLGSRWQDHQAWLQAYLREELRQRLMALGWRPKR